MKTTNYEISKQLKEAGFEAESEFFWHSINDKIELLHVARAGFGDFKSYELETILDALPRSIIRKHQSKEDYEVREFRERLIIEKKQIRYSCDDIENADDANRYFNEYGYAPQFSIYNFSNTGSLADTAGRMWLLLKEKGLI